MLPLMLASFWTGLLAFVFVLVSVFLILVILIQKPKGGGLSGAFGGAGGSQGAVFGAKTGDVLTWFTVSAFVVFLLLGIGLVFATRPESTTPTPTDLTGPDGLPGSGIDDMANFPPARPATTPESPATPTTPEIPATPAPSPDSNPKHDATPDPTPDPTPAPTPDPTPAPADGDKPAE